MQNRSYRPAQEAGLGQGSPDYRDSHPGTFPAHTNLQNYRGFVGHRARLSRFGLAQVENQVEELNPLTTGQSIKFSCRGIKFIYTRISRCFFSSFRLTMTRKI